MKKTEGTVMDLKRIESNEAVKRLLRNISEISKKLEDQKGQALIPIDLFTPQGEVLRAKLRDYCERLIIEDPVSHVQKTEELLWRRAFYDIVSAAKKLRKGYNLDEAEKAFLSTHLLVGIGFYNHLILQLQLEYNLQLTGVIDLAYPLNHNGLYKVEKKQNPPKELKEESINCVLKFIHRSLICLGDLARYQLDLDPSWDAGNAIRYYKMAITLNHIYGMPHNQLGTLAGNKNYGLDAVYHYMRSTMCEEPFEGAEGNLKRVIVINAINGHEKSLIQSCIARLFTILQLWGSEVVDFDKINEESLTLLSDIDQCFIIEKCKIKIQELAEREDSIEKYLSHFTSEETNGLSHEMIFKIAMICLMMTSKVQARNSHVYRSVVAFTTAVLSYILKFSIAKLESSFFETATKGKPESQQIKILTKNDAFGIEDTILKVQPNNKNEDKQEEVVENCKKKQELVNGKNGKLKKTRSLVTKLRRRKKRDSISDSEGSDIDLMYYGSTSDETGSDISESDHEDMSDEYSDSDEALSADYTDDEKYEIEELNGHSDEKEINKSNEVEKNEKNEYKDFSNTETSGSADIINNADGLNGNDKDEIKKKNLSSLEILNILKDEKNLVSIKIYCDWLIGCEDVIKTCAKGSKSLIKKFITFINLVQVDIEDALEKLDQGSEIFLKLEEVEFIVKTVPLPEEIDMRGLKIFNKAYKNINWNILKRKKMSIMEETLLRSLKIINFGHYLCTIKETGITYDAKQNLFVMSENYNYHKDTSTKYNNKNYRHDKSKGKILRNVRKSNFKSDKKRFGNGLRQPLQSYLVPDHEAISRYMPLLKRLVYSKEFVVIVPSIVVSALEEMKNMNKYAKEAIKWLEIQLKKGSRFLRVQGTNEKMSLPYIKAPKPKDKEAWTYHQIIECCNYLRNRQNGYNRENPTLTLLSGMDNTLDFTFNPQGLARSAGTNYEHIRVFHGKWKSSTKSHG